MNFYLLDLASEASSVHLTRESRPPHNSLKTSLSKQTNKGYKYQQARLNSKRVPIYCSRDVPVVCETLNVEWDRCCDSTHRLLYLFNLCHQSKKTFWLPHYSYFIFLFKLLCKIFSQCKVKVPPSYCRVKCFGKNLHQGRKLISKKEAYKNTDI